MSDGVATSVAERNAALIEWYERSHRDFPWRRTSDPYRILVSETMLQQTRVETVVPYYQRFLARFPDVRQLAAAESDEVLSLWSGLGYYSRARSLHRAAQLLVAEYDGVFPETAEALRELPGIGPYTAGAISAIAFDRPEAAVDGNVVRVLSRLFGIRGEVGRPAVRREIEAHALALAEGPHPGDQCQALMELGALVCVPRVPRCLLCPLQTDCDAFEAGDPASLPNKAKKKAPTRVEAACVLLRRGRRYLAVKRPERGLLGGLWDLPGGEIVAGEDAASSLIATLERDLGLRLAEPPTAMGQVEHVFTHRKLTLFVFAAEAAGGRIRRRGFDDHRWLGLSALTDLPHGNLTEKVFRLLEIPIGS